MRNRHLVADDAKRVVRRLFRFSVAESREVTFDAGAQVVLLLPRFGLSVDSRAVIEDGIDVLGAAVSATVGILWVLNGTGFRKVFAGVRSLFSRQERTAELASVTRAVFPRAVAHHRQTGFAERTAGFVEKKRFFALVARIQLDDRLRLHLLDEEGVELAHVVAGVGDEDHALFHLVNAFEFPQEFSNDEVVRLVVRSGDLHQRNAFFRHEDVGSIAPEIRCLFLPVPRGIGIDGANLSITRKSRAYFL